MDYDDDYTYNGGPTSCKTYFDDNDDNPVQNVSAFETCMVGVQPWYPSASIPGSNTTTYLSSRNLCIETVNKMKAGISDSASGVTAGALLAVLSAVALFV